MINKFENYLKNGKVKIKIKDKYESRSLFEKASERYEYIKNNKIEEYNAFIILEGAYQVSRELAQSLMSLNGYKPYSHEATIAFIKEFYSDILCERELKIFNNMRKIRNDSTYRGSPVSIDEAVKSLKLAKSFLGKIKDFYSRSNLMN